MSEIHRVTFAAGSGHLDRSVHLRDVSEDLMRHRRAALLPVFHDRILIDTEATEPRLGWVPPLKDYLDEATEQPIFLGLSGETPCFAADFTAMDDALANAQFCAGAEFMDLRTIAASLGPASASIAATAKGILGWHAVNMFCGACGARTVQENGGWRRACPECQIRHFPRTDPVVLMLILRDDNALMARQSVWPGGLFSLPAGFMEPGETIEDAVRREAKAQTGIELGQVDYAGCQPWPFPGSLMIGCVAEAETTEITVDQVELETAQWISRAKMQVIMDGKHPRMNAPRPDSLARAILADWVEDRVKLS